jgi:hypothetical protein
LTVETNCGLIRMFTSVFEVSRIIFSQPKCF